MTSRSDIKNRYLYRQSEQNIFAEIIAIKNQIRELTKISNTVKIGKVTHKRSDGRIRVSNASTDSNAGSYWLLPSSLMLQLYEQLEIGDYVLYSYPFEDKLRGVYFSIIDPEVILDIDIPEPPNLEGFATEDWVNTNYYNKTTIDSDFYNSVESNALFETKTDSTNKYNFILENLVKRYKHNNFIQASKGAAVSASAQWFNTQVTLTCNGSDLPTSGTPSQDALPAIQINISSTTDSEAATGTRIYFKIATTARINIAGTNNVVLAGVTNGIFLMPVQTQWYVTKTGSLAWSLDSVDYDHKPYTL